MENAHFTQSDAICPECGAMLSGDSALAGLCPGCLLKEGAVPLTEAGERRAFEPPLPADLAPLFPQLEIIGFIGQGGMGAVYKARQKDLDRIVALKILPSTIGCTPGFADRFAREAKALAKLNHPGIVTIHEFGRAGDLIYFLMEFVDGVTLGQLLARGRLSPREALAIVPEICDALQFAHDNGIVHRDIKPANILLDRRGRVRVADFGLVKLIAERDNSNAETIIGFSDGFLTEAGRRMGTPSYMAPEQSEHPTEVDHRADIYALGVVFYEMLTGELPQSRITLPSRKVVLDVRLDEVVLRTLEKAPDLRYQQASQVREAVEKISGTTVADPAPRSWKISSSGDGKPSSLVTKKHRSRVLIGCTIIGLGAMIWGISKYGHGARESSSSVQAEDGTTVGGVQRLGPSGDKDTVPILVATITKETGVSEAKAPGGGAVRLLAISAADRPNTWWRPDGRLVVEEFPITIRGEPGSREPSAARDHFLLWDYRDCPGSAGPGVFEPAGNFVYWSSVDQGELLLGLGATRMTFPSGARTFAYRNEIGLGQWKVICTLDPHRLHYVRTPFPEAPAFDSWQDPVDTPNGIHIGMILEANERFADQIIAVDKKGNRCWPSGGGSKRVGGLVIREFRNFKEAPRPNVAPNPPPPILALSDVKEFQAQVQRLYSVEFKGIPLQPSEPLPPVISK